MQYVSQSEKIKKKEDNISVMFLMLLTGKKCFEVIFIENSHYNINLYP